MKKCNKNSTSETRIFGDFFFRRCHHASFTFSFEASTRSHPDGEIFRPTIPSHRMINKNLKFKVKKLCGARLKKNPDHLVVDVFTPENSKMMTTFSDASQPQYIVYHCQQKTSLRLNFKFSLVSRVCASLN